jgi:catechol 2,3-dioxygenase-like lactoylglutathione lyase family enzyme
LRYVESSGCRERAGGAGKRQGRAIMKIWLHHVNLCSTNVPAMDDFYRGVLDLTSVPTMSAARVTSAGYAGAVSFVSDGTTQVHLAERDLGCGFRTGNVINPVERGHIAFRTDDIAAFKQRLRERGVPFSDYGAWAMTGWEQIFFLDPEGNVIEVHQVHEASAAGKTEHSADPE